MNHSLMVWRVHGPGLPPLMASMVVSTRPLGRWKSVTGQPSVYLSMKACQTRPGPLIEKTTALPGDGGVWSLLPIHTPTAIDGWSDPLGCCAMSPYVDMSRTSLVVPVLSASGRCCPRGPLWSSKIGPHSTLMFRSELPSRMLAICHAACADQTLRFNCDGSAGW